MTTSQFIRTGMAAVLLALFAPAVTTAQQTGVITGRVLEQGTGRPIADAVVAVAGTSVAGRTSTNGGYRLTGVAEGATVLRATRLGFAAATRNVNVGAGAAVNVDFTLAQTATQLDAVVTSAVTGQAERAREVGTNVGTISVANLQKGPITKFSDLLQGRTSGVTVQQTAGSSGTGQRIRVRGSNSLSLSNEPLVFVDGTNVTNSNALTYGVGGQAVSRLNDVGADDIEKLEILKGPAATAIYGTAAANGVILITTKRGSLGKPRWNIYAERGNQEDVIDYPANYFRYRLVTPGAPVYLPTGAFNSAARVGCFNYNRAAGLCTGDSTAVVNTLMDSRTSPFVEGDIVKFGGSVAGGTDVTQYFLSGETNSEHGVVEFNTVNRLGLRGNLNAKLAPTLDFAMSTQYTRSKLALNSNDNSVFSPLINGLVGSAFFTPPDSTGRPSTLNYRAFSIPDLANYVTHQDVDRFTMGGIANYRPLNWLSANMNIGLDYINRFDFRSLQPNRLPIAQSFTIGTRESNRTNNYLYTGTGSVAANTHPFETVTSRTTLGASYNRNVLQATSGTGAGIVEGTQNLGATSSLFTVDEGFSEIISIGTFVREELAWRDRLFISASLRRDDNSAFGNDFGFISYPGVSASWVLSDEAFFKKNDYLSNVRLRAAYGESGSRPDFRNAITTFTPVSTSVNNIETSAVTLGTTGNLDLKPELTKETEFGADLSLFSDRVSLEFTHFNKRSRDALISIPLAPSFGLTAAVLRNLGEIRNSGNEAQIDVRAYETPRFGLNLRASFTSLDNEIDRIGEDASGKPLPDIIINRGEQRHRKGFSGGAFFQRPVTFNDANGDGLLSRAEVTLGDTAVYLGEAIPTWNRGFSFDIKLFSIIRISTLFESRGGNQQLNGSEQFRCTSATSFPDRGCSATGNPDASLVEQAAFIAATFGGAAPSIAGTSKALYIEDAGFTKWRELSISLEAPESWSFLRTAGARGASLTFSGRNLKTWTDYNGLDPEIVESATSNFNQSEFNTQPIPRFYTLRLNLNF